MSRLLVLGVGSPQGADRLGWLLVERLHGVVNEDQVRLLASDRPGSALLGLLEGVDGAIIVDAVVGACTPGTVVRRDAAALADDGRAFSSHELGVAQAISLGRSLGQLPSQLWLLGLCVDEQQTTLSEVALARLQDAVLGLLAELAADTVGAAEAADAQIS